MGGGGVRLRWREEIHPSWIDCPVLYLDATASLSVAERWLGPITPLADVQAAAPHMTLVQVHDRTFGYGAVIAPAGAVSGNPARANQRRIAEVMQVAAGAAGGAGLLVGPKAMITQTQTQGFIPAGWHTANYGALAVLTAFVRCPSPWLSAGRCRHRPSSSGWRRSSSHAMCKPLLIGILCGPAHA